jgi:hypothetical protein
MGKINTGLNFEVFKAQVFFKRLRMFQYPGLNIQERKYVDELILKSIKPNRVLRKKPQDWYTKTFKGFVPVLPIEPDIWQTKWGVLIQLRKALVDKDLFKVLELVYGISEKDYLHLELFNVFSAYKWLTDQLVIIRNAEEERFNGLSNEETEAGAEELRKFDYYGSLRSICPDLLKQDDYLDLPYAVVFRELAYIQKENEVKKRLHEIEQRKAKNKRP